MAVAGRHGQNLRSHIFGQAVSESCAVSVQDFGYAGDLRGRRSSGTGIGTGHQHMHLTTASEGGGYGIEGGDLDRRVVVFSNY